MDPDCKNNMPDADADKCIKKASQLLSSRMHSSKELFRKLLIKGFSKSDIDNTLSKLAEFGFINDNKFATSYSEELVRKGFGARKIKEQLFKRGLPKEIIDGILSTLQSESSEDMLETATDLLKRKMPSFDREENLMKRKQKIFRFLAARGYPTDIISKAISACRLKDGLRDAFSEVGDIRSGKKKPGTLKSFIDEL